MNALQLHRTQPNEERYADFCALPSKLYSEEELAKNSLHTHKQKHLLCLLVAYQSNEVVGRMAVYHNPELHYPDPHNKTLCIGAYESIDDASVTKALLDKATAIAQEQECTYIIGPMEGSTWYGYRFNVEGEAARFTMEPLHKAYYPALFEAAGMETIGAYVSQLDDNIIKTTEQLQAGALPEQFNGLHFRHINMEAFEEELERIGSFCLEAFKENFLYTPLAVADFVQLYLPYKSAFKKELVYIAETQNGDIDAILFCMPNYNDPTGSSFIVKTVARKKDSSYRGTGRYMSRLVYEEAHKLNYTKAIHALIYDTNFSKGMSKDFEGKDYKRYALYGRAVQ